MAVGVLRGYHLIFLSLARFLVIFALSSASLSAIFVDFDYLSFDFDFDFAILVSFDLLLGYLLSWKLLHVDFGFWSLIGMHRNLLCFDSGYRLCFLVLLQCTRNDWFSFVCSILVSIFNYLFDWSSIVHLLSVSILLLP